MSNNPSEIILICWSAAQETFLININVWKRLCSLIFFIMETVIFFFRILWWIERYRDQHLFEIEIICNFINVLLSILINLMCPRWIKVLISLKNTHTADPKHLNRSVLKIHFPTITFPFLTGIQNTKTDSFMNTEHNSHQLCLIHQSCLTI